MKRIIALLTLLLLASAFALASPPAPARADGIIIIDPPICRPPCPIPPPPPRETPYLTVQNHRVNVTIENQVATTRVDQVFRNDSQWSLEGTYIFPLPENAAISDFAMWINGQKVEGQLYTKEEARRIYDDIVRRRLDPALLEYIGRDLFQASIFPIDPGDTRRVEIEYSQILPVDNGLVHYVYPLSTERFSARPLEDVSVTVNIKSNEPIKAVYSASHPVSISREGRFGALVGWEDANVLPTADFSLYYTVSQDDIGVNLLSYKAQDEDGFFVLLVAPNVDAEQVVDKDVILILDVSGSMEGEKMEQAREALKYVLDHLNQGDRFNIIAFSTGVRAFSSRPEPLSALPEARRFVDELRPEGSTDINRALLEAINAADRERPTIIVFLTDGLPTSGVVETPQILANVEQAAGPNLRIFPFGVGDDVDTVLLDTLAQEQRGVSAYVRPGERVDEQVSSFYAKVSTPVLADLSLDVTGVTLEDTYPYPLPDLFAGMQLILTGRYRDGGPASATLTGQVNGQERTFRFDDLTFASGPATSNRSAEFIPRLWATRKVGYLLNQIRLHGENRETIDEIVNLSVRYGIITPYTSFLVEEPELALSQEGRGQLADEAFAAEAAAPAEVSGDAAVSKAVEQNSLAGAAQAAPLPLATATAGTDGTGGATASTAAVTAVGDKAFVLKDGVWTDTTFDPTAMTTTQLPFPSDLFLEFLGDHPDAGKYFALGERVIVVLDGVAYETIPGDSAGLSNNNIEAKAEVESTFSSQPSTQAQSLLINVTADVTEGVAPLAINFTGTLANGSEEARKYACQMGQFEFGDGNSLSINSAACDPERERSDIANYVYDEPGEYQVTYSLNDLKSEPLTIIVRSAGDTPRPTETPKSVAVQATLTPPEPPSGTPAEPANTPETPTPGNSQATNQAAVNSIYNVWALVLLPLAGLAIGWFIWGRGRNR
jgi:Ca-activated chloride channel family protein